MSIVTGDRIKGGPCIGAHCRCGCSQRASGSAARQKPPDVRGEAFSLFAYERGNDSVPPVRRERIPEALLPLAVKWAYDQGCTTVLTEKHQARPFHPTIVHHVCFDPSCPGGC